MTAEEYRKAYQRVLVISRGIETLTSLSALLANQSWAESTQPARRRPRDIHVDMERVRILRKAQLALERLRRSHGEASEAEG